MRWLGRLVLLALLAALLVWAWPHLRHTLDLVRLMREPAPQVLPVPVEGVTPRRLVDTWGASRSGGRAHQGIDIFAPRGTPVLSATRGIIVNKGWNQLGGRTVMVLGPGGQRHYYAHLDEWDAPEIGDWVAPGTVLGYVGNTGNAAGTPPHLHYGIYEMEGARNPYPLLTGRGAP